MNLFEKIMVGTLFPLLFCVIGVLLLRQGAHYVKTKMEKKRRCLSHTYGRIVDIDSMTTGRRLRRAYFPTYEYMVGGEMIKVEIKWGTTSCQYRRGDQVMVWYDANNPQYSYIEGYKQDNTAAAGGMFLGSMFALAGLFVIFLVWFG